MFKNKNVQIGIGVVLVIAVLVGGYFFIAGKSKPQETEEVMQEDVVQKLDAKEIGLTMEASPDNKRVRFVIEKLTGITSVEYEVTYEADSTAQEQSEGGEARVQRGITGEAELMSGESSYESEWLVLGSESASTIRYDKGVESVDLTLKIKKSDGKTYAVQDTLSLE